MKNSPSKKSPQPTAVRLPGNEGPFLLPFGQGFAPRSKLPSKRERILSSIPPPVHPAAGSAFADGAASGAGSSGLIVKKQGQRPPVGGGFADTLAVVAVALGRIVSKFYVVVNE